MLLNQFPLHHIFNHIFGINENDGSCIYISDMSTQAWYLVYRLLQYCLKLVHSYFTR